MQPYEGLFMIVVFCLFGANIDITLGQLEINKICKITNTRLKYNGRRFTRQLKALNHPLVVVTPK